MNIGSSPCQNSWMTFVDADDLHPQTNKPKMMCKGEPLTDADRAPWLVNMRRKALKDSESDSQDGTARVVVACSALKVKYQEVLRGNLQSSICLLSGGWRP